MFPHPSEPQSFKLEELEATDTNAKLRVTGIDAEGTPFSGTVRVDFLMAETYGDCEYEADTGTFEGEPEAFQPIFDAVCERYRIGEAGRDDNDD